MLGTVTVPSVTFHDYVRQVAREAGRPEANGKIAASIGTTENTVRDWQHNQPTIRWVLAFAREYGRPIPEVLMQAYGLTADELGVPVSMDPSRLSNDELVSEVARRLQAVEEGSDPADVSTSDRLKRRQAEGRSRNPHRATR
jgi:hypothetical protein